MVSQHSPGQSLVTGTEADAQPWVRYPATSCHAQTTLRLIGGKWKTMILYELAGETRRYGALKTALAGVSAQVLTTSLRELESDGLIARQIFAEVPPRSEYRLTALGQSLEPVIASMCQWGHRYEEERR